MARFSLGRPSRFFRRSKTTSNTSTTASSAHTTSDTASPYRSRTKEDHSASPAWDRAGSQDTYCGASCPSLPLELSGPRTSASLTKLGDRVLETPSTGVPDTAREATRGQAVRAVGQLEHTRRARAQAEAEAEGAPSRISGSETLAASGTGSLADKGGERLLGGESGEAANGGVPAEDVKLEREDIVRASGVPPALKVQEPTPDVLEEHQRKEQNCSSVSSSRPRSRDVPTTERRYAQNESIDARRSFSDHSVSPSTSLADLAAHRSHLSISGHPNERIVNTLIDAPPKREGDSLHSAASTALPTSAAARYFTPSLPNIASTMHRKIWVRRPGASATLVQIKEDDLVDDVRDMILKKYANSLGRTFDAPDMTLRILQRVEPGQQRHERIVGPEEDICRTIDSNFPGGQMVDDALIIDVPQKRTPRPSPRAYQYPAYQALEEYRPVETGTDYFPPMPAIAQPSLPPTAGSHEGRVQGHPSAGPYHPGVQALQQQPISGLDPHQRSISVLNTGQIPPLPSPGGSRRHRDHRPKYQRQHTSSPTVVSHLPPNGNAVVVNPSSAAPPNLNPAHPLISRGSTRQRIDSSTPDGHNVGHSNGASAAPALPTPPAAEGPVGAGGSAKGTGSSPPTPNQGAAPLPGYRATRPKKMRKPTPEAPGQPGNRNRHRGSTANGTASPANANGALGPNSMLDGAVPPINVLLVEDNIINLRILESLMKRLKVRWETAMNGQIAVDKWKKGGFHLVLMDIQMPVMNGLAATKEIRRLERVNGIGVFSSPSLEHRKSQAEALTNGERPPMEDGEGAALAGEESGKQKDEAESDRLQVAEGLFKSPVIIVALTASSLQSDRHEALAAGCNDFLTKPVNFVWLERKVKEWGCMQALIDFDGWRRWKDYASQIEAGKSEAERIKEKEAEEKQKVKMEKMAKLQEKQKVRREEEERRKEADRRRKRASAGGSSDAGGRSLNGVAEDGEGEGTGVAAGLVVAGTEGQANGSGNGEVEPA